MQRGTERGSGRHRKEANGRKTQEKKGKEAWEACRGSRHQKACKRCPEKGREDNLRKGTNQKKAQPAGSRVGMPVSTFFCLSATVCL